MIPQIFFKKSIFWKVEIKSSRNSCHRKRLATGGLSLAAVLWHWLIMIDRKLNFFPDTDEEFLLSGPVLVTGQHFLLWGPTSSDAPIVFDREKTTKIAFLQYLLKKKSKLSFAFSRFMSCSNTVTIIKLCIITIPTNPIFKIWQGGQLNDVFGKFFDNSEEFKSRNLGYWSVILHLKGWNKKVSSSFMSLELISYQNEKKRLKYLIKRLSKIHKSLLWLDLKVL